MLHVVIFTDEFQLSCVSSYHGQLLQQVLNSKKMPPKNKEQQKKPFQDLKKETSQSTAGMSPSI